MGRCVLSGLLAVVSATWPAAANEVVWTANGTVTLVGGPGFTALLAEQDQVQIELRYDDDAPAEPGAISDIPGLLTHQEFRQDLDLRYDVTVQGATWRGTLSSGEVGRPYTVELQDFKIGPETFDFFRVRLGGNDGATFPLFPGATAGESTEMRLEFRSAPSDSAAGPDYLGSVDLKCVAQATSRIATATGLVAVEFEGGFEFVLDPASIQTKRLNEEPLALKSIQYDPEFEEVTLSWETEPGEFYVIQYLDEFLCWRDLFSVFADGVEATETFFPVGFPVPKSQVYRVVR